MGASPLAIPLAVTARVGAYIMKQQLAGVKLIADREAYDREVWAERDRGLDAA